MPTRDNTSLDTAARRPRGVLIFLAVWFVLQLPRLIAIPLIGDVHAGIDDPAWLYPAILDVVVALAAIPVTWLVWTRRGLLPYVAAVVLLVVSIVDHGDAITAASVAPTPQVFGGEDAPFPAGLFPGVQTIVDVIGLWLLSRPHVRDWFGVLTSTRS